MKHYKFDGLQDEEVSSDEEILSDKSVYEGEDEGEEEGTDRHLRMLQEITGIPKEAFDGDSLIWQKYLKKVSNFL